ncbi:hypothetical protein Krac_10346 [Ktedonobacter racemifer DSM 44963]|uniref:Uncharacterized protein n=1 Tax=Ktedonobacter racemifer DSM 44963 TaxID=485913 RepID=D6TGR5_KTERA|nr:hypothetical protein Krac_10346 [Ktedonobacter racemifer DSM 44963]
MPLPPLNTCFSKGVRINFKQKEPLQDTICNITPEEAPPRGSGISSNALSSEHTSRSPRHTTFSHCFLMTTASPMYSGKLSSFV